MYINTGGAGIVIYLCDNGHTDQKNKAGNLSHAKELVNKLSEEITQHVEK